MHLLCRWLGATRIRRQCVFTVRHHRSSKQVVHLDVKVVFLDKLRSSVAETLSSALWMEKSSFRKSHCCAHASGLRKRSNRRSRSLHAPPKRALVKTRKRSQRRLRNDFFIRDVQLGENPGSDNPMVAKITGLHNCLDAKTTDRQPLAQSLLQRYQRCLRRVEDRCAMSRRSIPQRHRAPSIVEQTTYSFLSWMAASACPFAAESYPPLLVFTKQWSRKSTSPAPANAVPKTFHFGDGVSHRR